MPPERFPPDDPREWLRYARDDLAIARADLFGIAPEPFAFHAQQAAEKAIKAVLVKMNVDFPYTHDVGHLLDLAADAGAEIPGEIDGARRISRYAILGRYPFETRVSETDRDAAVALADAVVLWAEDILRGNSDTETSTQ